MKLLRTLLQTLSRACQHDAQPAHHLRELAGAVDIYELERRMDQQARLRMALYAAGVGR
jgi:hypothetical protein